MTIEEVLRNRILYIGNEIPEAFTTDKRDKQLYLGSPQQLITELTRLFDEKFEEGFKQGFNDCKKMVEHGEHSNCCLIPGSKKPLVSPTEILNEER